MMRIGTMETFPSRCKCGKVVYLIRRGKVRLIPAGHECFAREQQEDVMRTIRAEESVGITHSDAEINKRLRAWRLGPALVPAIEEF